MITVNNVSMNFSGQTLFKDVELKFVPGNCYGIIGANGAGKSTFLRILSGDLEPTTGEVIIPKEERMSILKQDHFQYDAYTVLDTVMMGNQRLYDCGKEKDAIYEKEDFTDEDGVKASELEAEFAEMGGWEAESDVSRLIQGLGLSNDILYSEMSSLTAKEKVKVLLAQALFGKPDIILLDEPTNHLDIQAIEWLEDFLMDCESLILVVSHDRHFLNTVCTNIVDVDYGHIKMYVGNYEFWYESSQMMQRLIRDQNKKKEEKIKELQEFVSTPSLMEITDLEIVPYGKAHIVSENPPTFRCQHGERECYGNKVELCGLAHFPEEGLNMMNCMQAEYNFEDETVTRCAKKSNVDGDVILACAKGDEGNELMLRAGKITPTLSYVPSIMVNGKLHTDPERIINYVCDAYTGEKPAVCKKSSRCKWCYNW